MIIHIRSITENDFPFLMKVYRSTREKELETTGWTEEEKTKFTDIQFNTQHSYYTNSYIGTEFKIIEVNNVDVGRLYTWRTNDQIRIMDIAILPEHIRRGIGTKILTDLVKESEQTGKKLNIHVEYNNPAVRLYERLGFKKTDDTGIYFFMERVPLSNSLH